MAAENYILAGLGNPGEKYAGSRHNIGFEVIDAFSAHLKAAVATSKWDALYAKTAVNDATVHLVKPMTYMNLSGRAVSRFVEFYKIPINRLVVVHDDLDMKVGRLKLVRGGGAGGHNGIRSLVDSLGSAEFYRLKIGIGRPGSGSVPAEIPVERFVLTRFSEEENRHISDRFATMVNGLKTLIDGEPLRAMNFLNSFK